MKLKYILLAIMAVMTLGLVSCINKEDPTPSLIDKLCSIYGQTAEQGIEIAKEMGYTQVKSQGDDMFVCYENESELANLNCITLITSDSKVGLIEYSQKYTGNVVAEKGKWLSELVGESRTVGNFTFKFSEGTTGTGQKPKYTYSYSEFLQQVGNAQNTVFGGWGFDIEQNEQYGISVMVYGEETSTSTAVMIGNLGLFKYGSDL